VGALVVVAGAVVPASTAPASTPAPTGDTGSPSRSSLELVAQTATVSPGGQWDASVALGATPVDGSLEVVLHGRVRSRSELATSRDGIGLRSVIRAVTRPIVELPVNPDGSRVVSISLDPATPGGVSLRAAGAYPVEIVGHDVSGTEVSTLITHLLVEPAPDDELPPLAVAIVAGIGGPPTLQPDGRTELNQRAVKADADLLDAISTSPAPVTLAPAPETIDALARSEDPESARLLERLGRLGRTHPALAGPYVATSPSALVTAGLEPELGRQLDNGRQVVQAALGTAPSSATWWAASDLTERGVAALHRAGVRHVVVAAEQLEALSGGSGGLSLAQPFLVGSDEGEDLDALVLDPDLVDRLETSASPALEVSRLLAELTVLWLERPGIERAAVLPIDSSVRPAVVKALLAGLRTSEIFTVVPLDDAFTSSDRLRQPGGSEVHRGLVPSSPTKISNRVARDLEGAWATLASLSALVGPDSPRVASMAQHLLLATSSEVPVDDQVAHLEAAEDLVSSFTGSVTAPPDQTVTLTARDGTVPLTLRNDSGGPVNVVVRLRSPKLEFPEGDTIPLVLTTAATRVNISVRTRASGAFPLDIEVTSPDGGVTLVSLSYSIRSTAVSGVGVVLSAGAALFLLVWWGRHWTRTRRSTKLVGAHHPHSPA
jgi:hypothetical protein